MAAAWPASHERRLCLMRRVGSRTLRDMSAPPSPLMFQGLLAGVVRVLAPPWKARLRSAMSGFPLGRPKQDCLSDRWPCLNPPLHGSGDPTCVVASRRPGGLRLDPAKTTHAQHVTPPCHAGCCFTRRGPTHAHHQPMRGMSSNSLSRSLAECGRDLA